MAAVPKIKIGAHLDGLSPYLLPDEESCDLRLKLDLNESPIAQPSEVVNELVQSVTNWNISRYPTSAALLALHDAFASMMQIKRENVLVTHGSDSGLLSVCQTFIEKTDAMVTLTPTYTHAILHCQSSGGRVIEINHAATTDETGQSLHIDAKYIDQLRAKVIEENAKVVYLCSPNNPTGIEVHNDDILRLAQEFPKKVFLVDEAYKEFSKLSSAVKLINIAPNVIVTRTMSKLFGLAALRVGFVVAHVDIITMLQKVHNPKSVTGLATRVATVALTTALPKYQRVIKEINWTREVLGRWLKALNIEIVGGAGPFLSLRIPAGLASKMFIHNMKVNQGIAIRDRGMLVGMDNCVRVTVGSRDQMATFADAFLVETGISQNDASMPFYNQLLGDPFNIN